MKTIRIKLVLTMLGLALMIIVVLNIVSIRAINRTSDETLMGSAKPMSAQAAKNLNNTMDQYVTDLSIGVKSSSFSKANTQDAYFSILKDQFPNDVKDYISFTIYNDNGSLKFSNCKYPNSLKKEEVLKCVGLKEPIVTAIKVYNCPNGDQKILFNILMDYNEKNKHIIAGVTIDTEVFIEMFNNTAAGEHGFVFLLDSDGTTLLHTNNQLALDRTNVINDAAGNKNYNEIAEATKNIISRSESSGTYEFEGTDYIYGSCRTNYFDSYLVYAMTISDFTSEKSSVTLMIIISGIVILIATLIISIFFSNRISKPIVSSTKRINQLAQGNLSAPVEVWYSKDELGVLTSSLEETIVCIRKYINLIIVALNQISDGNLTHRMEGTFKGDFQQIKNNFNEILESLSDTFSSINTAAEQVNTGAIQVSNSAQAVSQGSTQQASAIEELSVTLKNVSKQVEQNSRDAKNAYNIVVSNTDDIGKCNDDMTNMISSINEIYSSSAEISKIIKVIDDIAFQTNILALNAAVEAAREGSKGFGVVADEVRRLASRSAEAAKQTADLIENSTAAVSKGTDIAHKTAESLNNIVVSSKKIQELVKNISEASEAQSESITQINTGLDQISDVVSANTSSSVGTASASEELSSQSLILKNMISRFKLSDDDDDDDEYRFAYNSAPDFDGPVVSNDNDDDDDDEFSGDDDDKY